MLVGVVEAPEAERFQHGGIEAGRARNDVNGEVNVLKSQHLHYFSSGRSLAAIR